MSFSPGYLTGDTAAEEGVTEQDEAAEDQDLLAEAVALAQASDVALVFAGSMGETEGADRDGIDLPAAHRELIERSPPLTRAPSWCSPTAACSRPGRGTPACPRSWRAGCSARPAAARSPTCCSAWSTRPAGWPRRSRSSSRTTPPTWTSPARTGTCATARAFTSATGASTPASRRWPTRSASASPTPRSSTARRAPSSPPTASRCGYRSPTPAAATGARSSRCT